MTGQNPYEPPFPGGQCNVQYYIDYQIEYASTQALTFPCGGYPAPAWTVTATNREPRRIGPFNGSIQELYWRYFGEPVTVRRPGWQVDRFADCKYYDYVLGVKAGGIYYDNQIVETANAIPYGVSTAVGTLGWCGFGTNNVWINPEAPTRIYRADGLPDDCGNLPNIPIDLAGHPGNCKRYPCSQTQPLNSEVELHTGALIETQSLVSYQSLGATRELILRYDSLTADPRPILHFRYAYVNNANQRLIAKLSVERGSFNYQVPGYQGTDFGLTGGEHFWSMPDVSSSTASGIIDGAIQADLSSQASGIFTHSLERRLESYTGSPTHQFGGTVPPRETLKFIHINRINSIFGSGWALEDWQEIIENLDGSALLLGGDNTQLGFDPPAIAGNPYTSPAGDFSTLVKLTDGTFQRTLKDRTVYSFNANKQLSMMRDRYGNQTRYNYDATGKLTQIVDPVNLTTTLAYTGTRVTSITDPANRVTRLTYDGAGNLIRITHPDNSQINYEYDTAHRMTASTDARGNRGTGQPRHDRLRFCRTGIGRSAQRWLDDPHPERGSERLISTIANSRFCQCTGVLQPRFHRSNYTRRCLY
jgi:YD repeat-containing protein